jgi:cytosine/adenosine deaminase-related metal-dependent hydrolase
MGVIAEARRLMSLLGFLLAAAAVQPETPEAVTAIVGATVVSAEAAPIRDAVVVIRGERIAKVGRRGQVEIPAGAARVQAAGKWVTPGLIDAHVHFFQSGGLYTRPDGFDFRKRVPYASEVAAIRQRLPDTFARYLKCGVTGVVDVGGPMWNFQVRDLARQTALAPRVAVAGPLVSSVSREALDIGDPPIIKAATPDEGRRLVRLQAARKPVLHGPRSPR